MPVLAAPKRPVPIPLEAEKMALVFDGGSNVTEVGSRLRDRSYTMSYDVRIRDEMNRIVQPGHMKKSRIYWTRVQFNDRGEIRRIWLLTEREKNYSTPAEVRAQERARQAREARRKAWESLSDEERDKIIKEREEKWLSGFPEEQREEKRKELEEWRKAREERRKQRE